MGSETPKGDIDDSKMLEESKTGDIDDTKMLEESKNGEIVDSRMLEELRAGDIDDSRMLEESRAGDIDDSRMLEESRAGDIDDSKMLEEAKTGDIDDSRMLEELKVGDIDDSRMLEEAKTGDIDDRRMLEEAKAGDIDDRRMLEESKAGDIDDRRMLEESKAGDIDDSKMLEESKAGDIDGSRMLEESKTGDIDDSIMLEEVKTQQLPSASPTIVISRSSSSRSSSSRSSSSSSHAEKHENIATITKSMSNGDMSYDHGTISVPSSPPHTPQWSMVSASPTDGLHTCQTTSPPVQTMGTPSGFDPNRIPASVFSSKPANASEWSVASNDSLFSIHMGNNSFTKDQFRSGELTSYDDWNASPSLYVTEAKSSELCSLPPLMEVPSNEEGSAKSSSVSTIEKEDIIDSPKAARGANTPPRLSVQSGHSSSSFAFPVLEADVGKANSFERVAEENPEVQTQILNATQDSEAGRWFSCFPCCPRCC